LVKNSKAKVKRTFQKYGIDLTEEVTIPSLDSFQTREEFNKWKEKTGSFTNRNNQRFQFVKNEHGVVASKSLLNEISRNRNREIRVAEQKLKDMENKPVYHKGELVSRQGLEILKLAGPDRAGIHIPKQFNFKDVRSRGRLDDLLKTTRKRADPNFFDKRTSKMHEVFIEELEKAFNSDSNWLVDKIKSMSPDDFIDMYKMYTSFDFQIFYILKYVNEGEQDKYLREMERDFERYEREEQPRLKEF
jgi:hypothetical protein